MYSINGVPLDNPDLQWEFRAPSRPISGIVKRLQTVRDQRDGLRRLASEFDAISLTLVVRTPKASLEHLYALFTAPTLVLTITGQPGRSVEIELETASPEGYGPADAIMDATFVVRVPAAFWRGQLVVSPPVALTAATHTVPCLPGISAPVGDAVVRVKGAAGSVQVADSAGSWFTIASIPANRWVRFHADSGRAFLMEAAGWSGGTEISGDVDFGGPRRRFEITPFFPDPLDPTVREGRLTVTTASRVGASIEVRAQPAHLI